jgi:hypothetical protein
MPTRILARSSPNTLAFSPHCSTGASGEPPNICAAPLGEKFQAIAAQNSFSSAHCATMRARPFWSFGYSVGVGCRCSSTSQISALSQ